MISKRIRACQQHRLDSMAEQGLKGDYNRFVKKRGIVKYR